MARRPRLGFIGIGIVGEAMTLPCLERVWSLRPDRYARVVPASTGEMCPLADAASISRLHEREGGA